MFCTYIYIYIERERERERDVYIYIYIYNTFRLKWIGQTPSSCIRPGIGSGFHGQFLLLLVVVVFS